MLILLTALYELKVHGKNVDCNCLEYWKYWKKVALYMYGNVLRNISGPKQDTLNKKFRVFIHGNMCAFGTVKFRRPLLTALSDDCFRLRCYQYLDNMVSDGKIN
jgi:hypothetical protein